MIPLETQILIYQTIFVLNKTGNTKKKTYYMHEDIGDIESV